jgi:hypothetical protein
MSVQPYLAIESTGDETTKLTCYCVPTAEYYRGWIGAEDLYAWGSVAIAILITTTVLSLTVYYIYRMLSLGVELVVGPRKPARDRVRHELPSSPSPPYAHRPSKRARGPKLAQDGPQTVSA